MTDIPKPEYLNAYFTVEKPRSGLPKRFGIVTAFNPEGILLPADENSRADAKLRAHLVAAGLPHFPVTGGSRDGLHVEPGYGIVVESPDNIQPISRRFGQDAFFWVEGGMVYVINTGGMGRHRVASWQTRARYKSEGEPEPWLQGVIRESLAKSHCVAPYCTTCGASEFRSAVYAALWARACPLEKAALPSRLADFPTTAKPRVIDCLARALGEIQECDEVLRPKFKQAVRLLLIEMSHNLLLGIMTGKSVQSHLRGTYAGQVLREAEDHSNMLSARRAERDEYERQVPERRRLRAAERQRAHLGRIEETRGKNDLRKDVLRKLVALEASERLRAMASVSLAIPLDAVPAEMVPLDVTAIAKLPQTEIVNLQTKIGRRRGVWGELKRLLLDAVHE